MSESPEDLTGLKEGSSIAGRYVIKSTIGQGGMGSVYLAYDVLLEADIAIKVLRPELMANKKHRTRFFREVELMRRIRHENVVAIFDMGIDAGERLLYFTMEYVPGVSLAATLDGDGFPMKKIASFIMQIAEGLDAIHEAGIIHRDLKPENIILTERDIYKITDFGVARGETSKLTEHDEILGSVNYVAPEIWEGHKLSPSLDFYSLGIVLYEICCSKVPFQAPSPAELMKLHLEASPTPPIDLNRKLPGWLSKLVLWLLKKEPGQRPSSGKEIIEFVEAYKSSWPANQEQPKRKTIYTTEGRALRILSVDDDAAIRNLVKAILENQQFEVVSLSNGEDAIELVSSESSCPEIDCAILDVNMLGVSGLEVLQKIRKLEHLKEIPVVMLTSLDSSEDLMAGYATGADYYITKPFTSDQLLHGIRIATGEK